MAYFYISCTKTTYQVLRLTLVSPPALLLPLLSHTRLALLALVLTLALALASGATHLPCTCACFASGARLALALALGLLPSPPSLSHASASLGVAKAGKGCEPWSNAMLGIYMHNCSARQGVGGKAGLSRGRSRFWLCIEHHFRHPLVYQSIAIWNETDDL